MYGKLCIKLCWMQKQSFVSLTSKLKLKFYHLQKLKFWISLRSDERFYSCGISVNKTWALTPLVSGYPYYQWEWAGSVSSVRVSRIWPSVSTHFLLSFNIRGIHLHKLIDYWGLNYEPRALPTDRWYANSGLVIGYCGSFSCHFLPYHQEGQRTQWSVTRICMHACLLGCLET